MAALEEETPKEWSEERLRFRILRSAYRVAAADCASAVPLSEIGADLGVAYEELYRSVNILQEHGFLFHLRDEPQVCITPRGIRYIEKAAGRRASVRLPGV